MKKNHIVIFLLTIGIIILCLSIILALISTGNNDIIGGADFATFLFVFFHEKKGLYSALAFLGIVIIIASAILGIVKKQK